VQCRVTCEDPNENFKPDNGRLEAYRLPGGPGIRLDGAVAAGNVISRHYDSLLTKVISHAPTYDEALRKLDRALNEFFVRGIKTNIGFVVNVLRHPEFAQVRGAARACNSFSVLDAAFWLRFARLLLVGIVVVLCLARMSMQSHTTTRTSSHPVSSHDGRIGGHENEPQRRARAAGPRVDVVHEEHGP
jgi:acetyl/propionyl-CoA carboxylase alpha subunit